ncbi:MAG: PLDc_N domain-containing protein, partial [Erysipelotrichaceae bacterium]|nr:PLDc_N domain-containing protein [Erysipelotrichaceae bacterium]
MTLFMIAVVLQLVWILSFFGAFENRAPEWDAALKVAAVLMALWIYGKDQNNTKQIPWIMLILVFPVVGFVLYVLTGRSGMLNKVRDTFEEVDRSVFAPIQQDEEV